MMVICLYEEEEHDRRAWIMETGPSSSACCQFSGVGGLK